MSSVYVDQDPDLDASRPRSGILTPSSDTSLNRRQTISSPAAFLKSSQDEAAMDQLLKPSIAVKPHPPKLHVPPRTLLPLMLLPRQHLPLASIDFDISNSDLPPSRFYESHIKILDLESRLGATRSIIIARSETTNISYALERQVNGLYVVCKLGSWVEPETLARHATVLCQERVFPTKPEPAQPLDQLAITTPNIHKETKKKRAAIEAIQSLVRKRTKAQQQPSATVANGNNSSSSPLNPEREAKKDAQDSQLGITASDNVTADVNAAADGHGTHAAMGPPPSSNIHPLEQTPQGMATTIFDNIRTQYFEALYRSKGSLAYFAKGPLSRARSAFHLDLEANLDMAHLIDFLKSIVLTTVQIDKKYRDSAPDIISKMNKLVQSSDEAQRKKRKTRKMRIGKDSLYPLEDDSIRKWWIANQPELKDDETRVSPTQIKSHMSLLRTRETQLQMIVIFEILALEPLKVAEDNAESGLPTLPGTADAKEEIGASQHVKKRNKHNLPVLVDVHADRLTIWQSTATDDQILLEDSQANIVTLDNKSQQKASSEPLKDFCTDVIVPFFSARLPDLCDSINRKLGGPVIITPHKHKLNRSRSKQEQKPGMAAKRPTPQNPQRTLQRALSTDQHHRRSVSRGPGNMIALMRSATSSIVPGLKREGSEPVGLRSMAKGEGDGSHAKRSGLSRSNSIASLDDMKSKRKALVEAQLKDAISGLRKPNRAVVGKAIAEAAEQRVATGMAKKAAKKVPRTSSSSVQVHATPANHRFKDVFHVKPEHSVSDTPLRSLEDVIPPSSIGTCVPSTASRVGFRNAVAAASTSPAVDMIGSTPTKQSAASFLRRPTNEGPFIPPSPLFKTAKRDAIDPPRSIGSSIATTKDSAPEQGLFATPAKGTAPRPSTIFESPVPQAQAQAQQKPSIYEQLGWDDDLDDL